jgi:large subunit ribosomal protein L18
MIKSHEKRLELQHRRRLRAKKRIDPYSGKPRLVVTRTNRHITAQIVDDMKHHTLVSASSAEKALADELGKIAGKTELAKKVGEVLGRRALQKSIQEVVFDRNGYLYHGRVRALADGAREAGLKI